MCAIAGEVSFDRIFEGFEPWHDGMQQCLARRGPDQAGRWHDRHCVLLHRRLAVVDVEGGIQPMAADGCTLIYNGELYNAPELRRELTACGHHFHTRSDTEIVLRAFLQWGEDCCDRLNGIFAFAVWDAKARRLFLARDPIGVKPLFFARRGQGLIFGSELKALLQHPAVEPEITREGLYDLFFLGPGRAPGSGVFRNVSELLPGQCAWFDGGGLHTRQYFTLRDGSPGESFEQCAEHVRFLVTDAIERQLVSDVPVCTFLSGGLDSSIISSVANRVLGSVRTFSVDYENNDQYFVPGKFQPNSDNAFIGIMTDYLHSEHHRIELHPGELVDALYEAAEARDLPGMADVDASMLLLCRAMKNFATVGLSGECADELFGGYPWYRDPEVRAVKGFPWSQTTGYRATFLRPEWQTEQRPEDYVRQWYQWTLDRTDCSQTTDPLERRMREMVMLNYQWFMQTLLDRKDRMSMWSGFEVRVPFCDRRIAEYLYQVPWAYKDYQGREKGLLRYAMRDILPPEIVHRKKSPYPKTWHPAYRDAVAARLQQELLDPSSPLLTLCRPEALAQLLEENRSLPWYGQLMTTPQTIAYFVQMAHWLRTYHVRIL